MKTGKGALALVQAGKGPDPLSDRGNNDLARRKLVRRLDGLTLKALDVLEHSMVDPNPAIRLTAAKEVLDRRFGRPKVEATVDVKVADMSALHLEALKQLAQAGLERLPPQSGQIIDVTPVPDKVETAQDSEEFPW